MVGEFFSNKAVNDPGFFTKIVFQSRGNLYPVLALIVDSMIWEFVVEGLLRREFVSKAEGITNKLIIDNTICFGTQS